MWRLNLTLLLAGLFLSSQAPGNIDPDLFSVLKARNIGPPNMSGRIGAIDAWDADPNLIYVGAATGGLWKSVDGGVTWAPVMDDQPVSSIGSIAVCQSNPDLVYVGTGEPSPRNSVGVGRGMYKTMDGGRTWIFLGLEATEKISRILLHPNNPDIVYAGALGTTWNEREDRGVYKSVDGGRTWEKILYVNPTTGAADMAMDPSNPNRILVGMWDHRRWPWFFRSGGPGSGLYMTVDGGNTWKQLKTENGLPSGELGRIGVGFAQNLPNVVYALVEAEKSVLLRSTDSGYNWQAVNESSDVGNRPFYYHRLNVNPVNENTLYILHTRMMISEDGGKSFRNLTQFYQAHSDFHAMWIQSKGDFMVVGNDGGVVISHNRGQSWRFVENLPLGQFYHVGFDMQTPYNVYGGLQDNGSWMGPAWVLKDNAIYDYDWTSVGGGDGFDVQPDPEVPGAGYGMSQGGNLYYFDTNLGISRYIVPTESDVRHRYNWNAGFAVDPFNPATIYLGSQFVHKSTDKGQSWTIISPDLTTNDPEKQKQAESGGLTLDVTNAENHCSILSIAPSPVKEGVIWAGTDDGNVQLTRDGGKTWTRVSEKLTTGKKGMPPPATWIPHVEPSRFDAARAYVVFDDHRRSNWTPYVFVTHDYGKSWKSLVTPEIDGFVHCIAEDTRDENLLFLGTEFGLFVSLNGGAGWFKWTHGVPTVPVRDLAVHPVENDLIIATHGRSLFILDDISPLREITDKIIATPLHLFKVPDAVLYVQGRMNSIMSPGDTRFSAMNKPLQAGITYYLIPGDDKKEEAAERPGMTGRMRAMAAQYGGLVRRRERSSNVKVQILDDRNQPVAEMNGTENRGLNRVYWDFRERDPQQAQPAGESRRYRTRGPQVLPGTYTAKVIYKDREVSQPFEVTFDPRVNVDRAVLEDNLEKARAAMGLSETLNEANERIQETMKVLKTLQEFLRSDTTGANRGLLRDVRGLERRLTQYAERINPTPAKQGIADRSAGLAGKVRSAAWGMAAGGIYPVSEAAMVRYENARAEMEAFLEKLNTFYADEVEKVKKALLESGFSPFKEYEPLIVQ